MEVVYIDPEPPGGGGGIRAYLRLSLRGCRDGGVAARVYTHEPSAYPGERAEAIGRKPWLPFPWRAAAYRLCYSQNVLYEHARWLRDELESGDAPDRVYEFADFLGYAFFALRSPALRERITVRIHTPAFLIGSPGPLAAALGRRRERFCLDAARFLTAPSAAFVREMLPGLARWEHLPNPLPPAAGREDAPPEGRRGGTGERILFLGRIEPRKGPLLLAKAFLRMAAARPKATLTFVGAEVPGPYAESLQALLASLTPGLRARIVREPPCAPEARAALLARFDLLAVPSHFENSPYVYFEGMAAGLDCVGSSTGEMREAAYVTGGILAEPGDEASWARALERACAGEGRAERLAAQEAYLQARRGEIPPRLIAHYRRVLAGAEAG